MKNLLALLLFALPSLLFAQNWSPIVPGEQQTYILEPADVFTHTLTVDSLISNDLDSTFFFNKRVEPCLDCDGIPGNDLVYLNQPCVFGSQAFFSEDSLFFIGFRDAVLPLNLTEGDAWQFTDSLIATVDSIRNVDTFNTPDEVRYISLSDDREIHWSKEFGFLRFPDLVGEEHYRMTGIKQRGVGEFVPGFKEFFGWEVGTKIYTRRGSYESGGLGFEPATETVKTILSVSFENGCYSYEIFKCSRTQNPPGLPLPGWSYNEETVTEIYCREHWEVHTDLNLHEMVSEFSHPYFSWSQDTIVPPHWWEGYPYNPGWCDIYEIEGTLAKMNFVPCSEEALENHWNWAYDTCSFWEDQDTNVVNMIPGFQWSGMNGEIKHVFMPQAGQTTQHDIINGFASNWQWTKGYEYSGGQFGQEIPECGEWNSILETESRNYALSLSEGFLHISDPNSELLGKLVQVYDVTGRLLHSEMISSSNIPINAASGIVLIAIPDERFIQRMVVE